MLRIPKYYDRMSLLLDAIIEQRRQEATEYADYLAQLLEHAAMVGTGESGAGVTYPNWASTAARRALCDFDWPDPVDVDVERVHQKVQSAKEHGWADNPMKERALARELRKVLASDFDAESLRSLIDRLKEHDPESDGRSDVNLSKGTGHYDGPSAGGCDEILDSDAVRTRRQPRPRHLHGYQSQGVCRRCLPRPVVEGPDGYMEVLRQFLDAHQRLQSAERGCGGLHAQ